MLETLYVLTNAEFEQAVYVSDPLPTPSVTRDESAACRDVDANVDLAEAMFDEYFSIHIDVARDGLEVVEKVMNKPTTLSYGYPDAKNGRDNRHADPQNKGIKTHRAMT